MEPSVVTSAVVSGAFREIARRVTDSMFSAFKKDANKWSWDDRKLASHLQWVASWSSTVQIGDMVRPERVESTTIAISLSYASGENTRLSDNQDILEEQDLLDDCSVYLISGDPGGGKTTTIRGIAQLLFQEPASRADKWQYPLVVLLRDIPKRRSLIAHLGGVLGLIFDTPETDTPSFIGHIVKCGSESLVDAVVRILVDTRGAVFLDGLDEVDPLDRKHVDAEIQELIRLLGDGKLIVSARTGAVERIFEDVHRVQLLPLDRSQEISIASRWLPSSDEFFDELDRMPYGDLAGRPLFLLIFP